MMLTLDEIALITALVVSAAAAFADLLESIARVKRAVAALLS